MEITTTEKPQLSELTTLAVKFYDEHLKAILEPEHIGEFVAIEPYSGRYFVHKTSTQAVLNARAEMPESKFYLARIGYDYAYKIGGSWLKKKVS